MNIWEIIKEWLGIVLAVFAIGYEIITSKMSDNLSEESLKSPAIDSLIGVLSIISLVTFAKVCYDTFRDKDILHGIIAGIVCIILLVVIGVSSRCFTRWTRQLGHPAALNIARFLALAGVLYEAALKLHWI